MKALVFPFLLLACSGFAQTGRLIIEDWLRLSSTSWYFKLEGTQLLRGDSVIPLAYDDTLDCLTANALTPGQYVLEYNTITFSIRFYGYGCEPYDGGTITLIKRQNGDCQATFEQDGKKWRKRRLKTGDLQRLVTFERQVRALPELYTGGSMTFCYNIMVNGAVIHSLKNAPGEWAGLENVRQFVFGKAGKK